MDNEGKSLGVTQYDTFGRPNSYGDVRNDVRGLMSFTGYEDDRGTGLMFVQARYYMPELGRFVEEDRNKGNGFVQESLNRYVYCINNHLMYVDRDGQVYVMMDYLIHDIQMGYQSYTLLGNYMISSDELENLYSLGTVVNGHLVADSKAIVDYLGLDMEKDKEIISSFQHNSSNSFASINDAALAFQLAYGEAGNEQAATIYKNTSGRYQFTMPGPFVGNFNTNDIWHGELEPTGNGLMAYVYTGCIRDITNSTNKPHYYMEEKVLFKDYGSSTEVVADLSVLFERPGNFIIPEEVIGYVNGNQITLNPLDNWGAPGKGDYPTGIQKDATTGRYKVAVGPKIINSQYPDTGKIWDGYDGINKGIEIDVIVKDKNGNLKTIECVVVDFKAHTYSNYPDGHPSHNLTGDTASFNVGNGLIQTGIAYPNSWNADKGQSFAPNHSNATVIEFAGHALDFNPSDYKLVDIKVIK